MAEVYSQLQERWDRRFGNFMALFANANRGSGKAFTAEDFMPVAKDQVQRDENELFALFDRFTAQHERIEGEK
tara:strand:+ start:825 stop:1043 length:219 start_codon:yes stop_codon:yes gene_type:complete